MFILGYWKWKVCNLIMEFGVKFGVTFIMFSDIIFNFLYPSWGVFRDCFPSYIPSWISSYFLCFILDIFRHLLKLSFSFSHKALVMKKFRFLKTSSSQTVFQVIPLSPAFYHPGFSFLSYMVSFLGSFSYSPCHYPNKVFDLLVSFCPFGKFPIWVIVNKTFWMVMLIRRW